MKIYRKKLHDVIDRLAEDNLGTAWKFLQTLYYDDFMLQEIQDAKQTLRPGDSLTREEALQVLYFEYGRAFVPKNKALSDPSTP